MTSWNWNFPFRIFCNSLSLSLSTHLCCSLSLPLSLSADGDESDPPASGFALTYVDDEFAVKPQDLFNATPPLPLGRFETRRDAKDFMCSGGAGGGALDPSPYRPMADTRFGSIVDVLTADVLGTGQHTRASSAAAKDSDESALEDYEVVVLAGPLRLRAAGALVDASPSPRAAYSTEALEQFVKRASRMRSPMQLDLMAASDAVASTTAEDSAMYDRLL